MDLVAWNSVHVVCGWGGQETHYAGVVKLCWLLFCDVSSTSLRHKRMAFWRDYVFPETKQPSAKQ